MKKLSKIAECNLCSLLYAIESVNLFKLTARIQIMSSASRWSSTCSMLNVYLQNILFILQIKADKSDIIKQLMLTKCVLRA